MPFKRNDELIYCARYRRRHFKHWSTVDLRRYRPIINSKVTAVTAVIATRGGGYI